MDDEKNIIEKAENTNKTFNHNFDHIKDINIINKGLENEKLKLYDKSKIDENEISNFLHIGIYYPIYPLNSIDPENFKAIVYNYLVKINKNMHAKNCSKLSNLYI